MLTHQGVNVGALRRPGTAAEPRAFDRRCRGGKVCRRLRRAPFGKREREGAVPDVAGGERIDGPDRKGRSPLFAASLPPKKAVGTDGHADDSGKRCCHARQPGARIADARRKGQPRRGEKRVGCAAGEVD